MSIKLYHSSTLIWQIGIVKAGQGMKILNQPNIIHKYSVQHKQIIFSLLHMQNYSL